LDNTSVFTFLFLIQILPLLSLSKCSGINVLISI
jgi:hypothetical protein